MNTTYSIRETWLDHAGGTKFYHPFLIAVEEDDAARRSRTIRSVTVLHFGGYRGDLTPYRRPVNGGQVQIKPGSYYGDQISKKRREGYDHYSEMERFQSFNDALPFYKEVTRLFGVEKTTEILNALELNLPGAAELSAPQPTNPVEDTPIEESVTRPAAWGSW